MQNTGSHVRYGGEMISILGVRQHGSGGILQRRRSLHLATSTDSATDAVARLRVIRISQAVGQVRTPAQRRFCELELPLTVHAAAIVYRTDAVSGAVASGRAHRELPSGATRGSEAGGLEPPSRERPHPAAPRSRSVTRAALAPIARYWRVWGRPNGRIYRIR